MKRYYKAASYLGGDYGVLRAGRLVGRNKTCILIRGRVETTRLKFGKPCSSQCSRTLDFPFSFIAAWR